MPRCVTMAAMRRTWWPAVGLVVGVAAGLVWGLSSGYEALDVALGTSLLCGLAGLLVGGVAYEIARRS
jgi:hypothetical protein